MEQHELCIYLNGMDVYFIYSIVCNVSRTYLTCRMDKGYIVSISIYKFNIFIISNSNDIQMIKISL